MIELFERYLLDRRRGMTGWAVGLVTYCLLIVAFYPSVRDSEGMAQAIDEYPDVLKELFGGDASFDLTSGAGFLNVEVYSFMLPLLMAVVAIGYGATIGAEQQSGQMDLVLANPVRRRWIVLAKAWAMTSSIVTLGAIVLAAVAILGGLVDLGVSVDRLTAGTVAVVVLVVFHGLVALAAGAASGQRSIAIGVATGVFAGGYLLNALGAFVDWLEPFRVLSPYHHGLGPNPLLNGWAWGHLTVLVVASLAVLGLAVVLFERRDLT